VLLLRQLQVERDYGHRPIQEQRVPAVRDGQRRRGGTHLGLFAGRRDGIMGPRHEIINGHAHLDHLTQGSRVRPKQIGELAKHSQRLPFLLDLCLAQCVA
jgi:hypothetical protein